ncbi:MAG: DUF6088 family protein [Tannerella sp.]|jgi:hypothetical protein|nr:DUF6088 family protein [Tannerella sp.]
MQSVYTKIREEIVSSDRGRLFFPYDFSSFGSPDAIRSTLVRLCQSDVITHVAQGIYCYPKIDTKWGSGIIPPDIEDIATGIAKRDKVRIIPTGAYVLNILGLSTQVPANVVFITDGAPRRISIGKGKGILFKHTSEMRNFAYRSQMMMLVVTAMREIGENNITLEQLGIINTHLANVTAEEFQNDIQLAPVWVRKTLQNR